MTERPAHGAEVRVTLEGTYKRFGSSAKTDWIDHPETGAVNAVACLTIEPAPIPEPTFGSVVLDRDGDAWQRGEDDDWTTFGAYAHLWADLLMDFGPLTVIYVPTEEATA